MSDFSLLPVCNNHSKIFLCCSLLHQFHVHPHLHSVRLPIQPTHIINKNTKTTKHGPFENQTETYPQKHTKLKIVRNSTFPFHTLTLPKCSRWLNYKLSFQVTLLVSVATYLLSQTVSVFNLLLVVLKINGFKNTRLPPAKRKQEENVNKTLK